MLERLRGLARDPRVGLAAVTLLFLLSLRGLEGIKARLGGEAAGLGLLEAGVAAAYAAALLGYLAMARRRG